MKKIISLGFVFQIVNFFIIDNGHACSVCFSQVKNDPHTIAIKQGVILMLVIVAVPLVLFAKFLLKIYKQEQLLAGKNKI